MPDMPTTACAPNRPTPIALWLGYGGLIPFIALAVAQKAGLGMDGHPKWLQMALLAYAASIVNFVAALHWGMAMRDPAGASSSRLVWSVVPGLLSWLSLLLALTLPASIGLWLNAVLFWICFAVDRQTYPVIGVPAWLSLRLHLTTVASICCAVSALS